jgi:hypothetical protein
MWFYQNNPISYLESLPNNEGAVGFVYKITNLVTGKFYIGKKALFHTSKVKIGKREKAETKTRKTFKRKTKESDWLTYYGSSDELVADVATLGTESFKREILEICYSKKYLAYAELKHMILHDVLTQSSYNGNILGKFFRRDMHANQVPT